MVCVEALVMVVAGALSLRRPGDRGRRRGPDRRQRDPCLAAAECRPRQAKPTGPCLRYGRSIIAAVRSPRSSSVPSLGRARAGRGLHGRCSAAPGHGRPASSADPRHEAVQHRAALGREAARPRSALPDTLATSPGRAGETSTIGSHQLPTHARPLRRVATVSGEVSVRPSAVQAPGDSADIADQSRKRDGQGRFSLGLMPPAFPDRPAFLRYTTGAWQPLQSGPCCPFSLPLRCAGAGNGLPAPPPPCKVSRARHRLC